MEGGRQLDLIPPNASPQDQMVLINRAIDALNNYSRDVVAKGSVLVSVTGPYIETTTVPHNLGYTPRAFANLDQRNLQVDAAGTTVNGANLPLPTALAWNLNFALSLASPQAWLEVFADTTNVYFRVLNSGAFTYPGGIPVKYFLTRDPAN